MPRTSMPRDPVPRGSRPLPGRPNLRYLKLEAKRRLAAGEFPALHYAQIAIAWEHGLPSWTALKQHICAQSAQDCQVLPQLSWLITRFRHADQHGWTAPAGQELQQHFAPEFLAALPAPQLIATISGVAPVLRRELAVVTQARLTAQVQLGGLDVFASVSADPPHKLTGLMAVPTGRQITDPRMSAPALARITGSVPAGLAQIAKGWADVDRGELLGPAHRWQAYCGSVLVTATAVLRLVAGGRVTLDNPVNDQIRTVRLEDAAITVRELLTHTAGVGSPAPSELLADSVPDLVSVTGPVVGCSGPRGPVRPSNGGYAVLGQLVADVTGEPYAEAATRLVLEPLGLASSSFPACAADLGPDAVTGYTVTPDGALTGVPAVICVMPAVGGLWCTAADLVRLGTTWSSLLPAELAREAVRPQTGPFAGGHRMGLGWIISPGDDLALHGGAAPPASTLLRLHLRSGQVQVILASRLIGLGPLSDRLLRSGAQAAR
jgi:CubicO group peptidase (beta-lactamase class C family)